MGINYDEGERANEERTKSEREGREYEERGEQSAVWIGEGKESGEGEYFVSTRSTVTLLVSESKSLPACSRASQTFTNE